MEIPDLRDVEASTMKSIRPAVKIGTIEIKLSQLEADWMDVIPHRFQIQAWHALSDMRKTMKFNNAIERHKGQLAFMDGFVQGIILAQQEEMYDEAKKEDKEAQPHSGVDETEIIGQSKT